MTRTTLKILAALVFVGVTVCPANAEIVVDMVKTAGAGPGGEDVYDFFLNYGAADGEFTNARLVVDMETAGIRDPDQGNTTGGMGGLPMDTWVSTVFDHAGGSGSSIIFNDYDPVFPPRVDTPPVALLDWSFFDTYSGDTSEYAPAQIARVLIDPDTIGQAAVSIWTTTSYRAMPTVFYFGINGPVDWLADDPVDPPDLTADNPTDPPDLTADDPVDPPDLTADNPADPPDLTADDPVDPPDLTADNPVDPPDLTADNPADPPDLTADDPVDPPDLTADNPVDPPD
ncbi:MAG: hypothetical protein SVV80_13700, partial [Planctomycetota bacterium]|nr:hypothetical protein [Planctomycetota bacterium]